MIHLNISHAGKHHIILYMQNNIIHHFLSSEEIDNLVNDSTVKLNKDKLSDTLSVVKFSIPLSDTIRSKLETSLSMDLSRVTTIPMRWIRGDTSAHIDRGETSFNHTYLVYLTDSIGQLIVDGQHYSIVAADAHIFSEGLEHSTVNTDNNERLLLGPMSETGFPVGGASISYYPANEQYDCGFSYYSSAYSGNNQYQFSTHILNIPPPIPTSSLPSEYINYWNNTGIDDSIIWAPPAGAMFGGWKLMDVPYNNPIGDNTVDKIYMPGETYDYTNSTTLIPNWIFVSAPSEPRMSFKMHFTDNSLVFYKPNSLSTGGGGSGVRNSRHKQRRT